MQNYVLDDRELGEMLQPGKCTHIGGAKIRDLLLALKRVLRICLEEKQRVQIFDFAANLTASRLFAEVIQERRDQIKIVEVDDKRKGILLVSDISELEDTIIVYGLSSYCYAIQGEYLPVRIFTFFLSLLLKNKNTAIILLDQLRIGKNQYMPIFPQIIKRYCQTQVEIQTSTEEVVLLLKNGTV